ncbi:MAG TPA: LysE family translocator [Paucimonas sp.]|nr:LysE family translocator [Paucimonas sp.]
MSIHTIFTFIVVAGLTIATPGPAILLSLRNGASYGVASVAWSALGNVCGVCCLSTAAMFGLGVVLKSSALLFGLLKLAGAGYLLYLGVRSLLGGSRSLAYSPEPEERAMPSRRRLFAEAFLTAATNPKALLFFTALFPQFINPDAALAPQFLVLTGIFMALAYLTHLAYAIAASRARKMLRRPGFAKWLNRTVGATFIGFAALLLAARRQAG